MIQFQRLVAFKKLRNTRFSWYIALTLLLSFQNVTSQKVGILKYNGGGDWYANPTSVPNLIEFCNTTIHTSIEEIPEKVAVNSIDIFNYPIVFMTGHGNVIFSEEDIQNLKSYLIAGGFLHISDNYGLDPYIRRELKKLFPDDDLVELPYDHPIYHQTFNFENGVPKIHEHDQKSPQGFGIFYQSRLICFYDYESDLSDGWEDSEVHQNDEQTRTKALKMGANIIEYVFKN